jgi:hypothetical protein
VLEGSLWKIANPRAIESVVADIMREGWDETVSFYAKV